MKKFVSLLITSVLIILTAGCSVDKTDKNGLSFTDDLGRTVTVSSTVRVAALLGSFADMWMLAGGTVCACADDAWEDFSLPLSENTVNLGSTHNPDKEALFASQPTLVLASAKLSKHLAMKEALEAAGVCTAYFDVGNFNDYLRVMKIMTDLTGKPENYIIHAKAQEEKIEAVKEKYKNEKPLRVLVMRASAANIRAKNSEDTMLGGMLADFGCINIADSDSMLLDNLSAESILLENPDKIFFIETGDDTESIRAATENMFRQNPLWSKLDAVRNGEVYFMDKALYNLKPNARFAEAYEKLGIILYEE